MLDKISSFGFENKKESHTGLEPTEGVIMMTILSFLVKYHPLL